MILAVHFNQPRIRKPHHGAVVVFYPEYWFQLKSSRRLVATWCVIRLDTLSQEHHKVVHTLRLIEPVTPAFVCMKNYAETKVVNEIAQK